MSGLGRFRDLKEVIIRNLKVIALFPKQTLIL